ncbi:MAG: SURF1 family protein [Pseudomonadota bacterium]
MKRVALALLGVTALAILLGLGTWQLQRLAWKEALIAAATLRPNAPAVPPPGPDAWPGFSIDDWNYRRVRLTGTFAPATARAWIVLGEPNGPLGGEGHFAVSPFRTEDGFTVMVNRGFVPKSEASPPPPAGPVTVEGLVRRDDPPAFITPEPDLEAALFFTRDISGMASALGAATPIAPYSVDLVAAETPASGVPQAGESRIRFSNNHLQYALTWYGLAGTLVGVAGVAIWRRRQKLSA